MIVGTLVTIRPLEHIDLELLYDWNQSNPAASFFLNMRYEVGQLSMEEIRKSTDRKGGMDTGLAMVIERCADRKIIGFGQIRSIAFDARHGELRLAAMAPELYDTAEFEEATMLLVRYLYRQRNIKKVHMRCFENEPGLKRLLEKLGFESQGTLRKHTWSGDEYLDIYDYALFRSNVTPEFLGEDIVVPAKGGRE